MAEQNNAVEQVCTPYFLIHFSVTDLVYVFCSMQQLISHYYQDAVTVFSQVCTLGAIREETGPALSEEESSRYKEMKGRYKELWNKIGARQVQLFNLKL